ncbi:hypothetical protein D0T51_00865 [Parabacteroides sp. 52]|uniref:phage holin family protein n=1 Tax=unclassified Parabacteroides TaxID=2649774 RepID=UPI0013D791DF|nr:MULTISPECIES: phage holin family protein [unclassified Parabacteroides]MDH6533536.1 hypothetical protein [Parabacteroides sp. PM5-20]NDV54288.1 hypothetical protein [Parabacteroides sp. 52]
MEKDLGQIFTELKKDVSAYAELKFELLKLNTYERAGKIVGLLSYALVLLFLAFLATLFLFLALGVQLGHWLDSTSAGFAIVGGIYLIIIGIVIIYKKSLTTKVMNIIIETLDGGDNENQKETGYGKKNDADRKAELQ